MNSEKWLFNQKALQDYLLKQCQDPKGGLIDKPGTRRDFYHTCYDLSGLSISQASFTQECIVGPPENKLVSYSFVLLNNIINDFSSLQVRIHPIYNLSVDSVRFATKFFSENPINLN